MQFVEGTPLLELRGRISELPERKRQAAKARILARWAGAALEGFEQRMIP